MNEDGFFTPPTLAELIDNMREQSELYRAAKSKHAQDERQEFMSRMALKSAKTLLDCAERAVIEYMKAQDATPTGEGRVQSL